MHISQCDTCLPGYKATLACIPISSTAKATATDNSHSQAAVSL